MFLRFLIVAASFLPLSGCSQSGNQTARDASGPAKPRIALIMKSLANEFFSTMASGAEAHQKDRVDQYDLVVNGIKDERDLSRQVALVDEMVASGVDAIVIAPADSRALVPVLRRAKKAGVVVINIDNKLDDDVLEKEKVTIPFVGPNNRKGAEKVGKYVAEMLDPTNDKVGILEGIPTSFNAQQRLAGFKDAMERAGLEIVDSQSADWEMSRANTIAMSMLSEHPEITALLCANDSMALGAIAAAKSAGRPEIKIAGFDNISAIRDAIKQGKAIATANQYGDQLAVFGIEAALAELAGSPSESRETPVDLVTAETL